MRKEGRWVSAGGVVPSFLKMIDTWYHIWPDLIRFFPESGPAELTGTPRIRRFASLSLAVLSILLAACGTTAPPAATSLPAGFHPSEADKLRVVATTTVLADLAANVGGGLVTVTSLVPPGAHVHSFQSTPGASLRIGQAGVVISNGAGLDDFLNPVLEGASRADVVHVVASQGLQPKPEPEYTTLGAPSDEHDGDGVEHLSGGDPHFWLDPILAQHYVERIRDGLIEADRENAPAYANNALAYLEQLTELDRGIQETLSQVPLERRRLVTFHDAYGYFARRYGWEVSAFVPSDASDVSPGDVVAVLEQIKQEGIPAVFAEPQFNSTVLRQAATDTGVKVGVLRSLVDSEADSYLKMMRANAESLAGNLK